MSSPNEPSTFFVRALYDYQSSDASSLSFRKGDLIEVLTQLDSGWWDGLLEDERGWFPRNYVVPVPDYEVEQEFQIRMGSRPGVEESRTAHQQPIRQDEESFFDTDDSRFSSSYDSPPTSSSNHIAPRPTPVESKDYWEPRLTPGGQIFFVNTTTGEESTELPSMGSDTDDEAEQRRNSMRGEDHTRTSRDWRRLSRAYASSSLRSSTPEPWIKRLTDDGIAYFYYNPYTNDVRWTPPSPVLQASTVGTEFSDGLTNTPELVSPYTSSSVLPNGLQKYPQSNSNETVSQVSPLPASYKPPETNGFSFGPEEFSGSSNKSAPSIVSSGRRNRAIRRLPDAPLTGPRTAIEYAKDMQRSLSTADDTNVLGSYVARAREAIETVIDTATDVMDESPSFPRDGMDFIRERRLAGEMGDALNPHPQLAGRVAQAAYAVLSLLLVSGKLIHPVESVDSSPEVSMQEYSKAAASDPLTSFHRKVGATLSKLVLSARAADAIPDARPTDMAVSVERDARELERSVITFVLELERAADQLRPRNMRATLDAGDDLSGVGTGVMGGGCAASWSGNGFVPIPNHGDAGGIMRQLDPSIIKELNDMSVLLDDAFTRLSDTVGLGYSELLQSRPASPSNPYLQDGDGMVVKEVPQHERPRLPQALVAKVTEQAASAVSSLSSFLRVVEQIDIASALDFDGLLSDVVAPTSSPADGYDANIRHARVFQRTYEIKKQSLYDQGADLLLSCQMAAGSQLQRWEARPNQGSYHFVSNAVTSLKSGMNELMDTLESLCEIAASQQADAVRTGRRGRIGLRSVWRNQAPIDLDGAPLHLGIFGSTDATGSNDQADTIRELYLSSSLHPFGTSSIQDIFTNMEDEVEPAPRHQLGSEDLRYQPSPPSPKLSSESDSRPNEEGREWNPSLSDDDDDGLIVRRPVKPKNRSDKLRNILGKETPSEIIEAQNEKSQPAYMKAVYGPPDILFHPDRGVRGGTLPALVEHLTMHNRLDSTFNDTFLMTFKSFASVDDVVTELVARFNLAPPEGLTPEQYADWKEHKQKILRFRTLNILKSLIQSQTLEQEDLHVLDRIRDFADSITQTDMLAPRNALLLAVKTRTQGAPSNIYTPAGLQSPPQSILPKSLKKFKLADLDSLEVARQLTIIESRLFNRVRPTECLARGRDRPAAGLAEDNIKSIITMSNQLAAWVADTVLSREEPRKRANILRYFINVADHCKRLQNFSSMSALIAGLNGPPIRRLRRSWEMVPQKSVAMLAELEKTMDSGKNFTAYRRMLDTIDPPCVPFIGIYLTYLTFIQDGNRSFIPVGDNQVINFDKRQRAAAIIREIQRYQAGTYDLLEVPAIGDFIQQSLVASSLKEPDLWNLSLEREPKEREEEKMARLLQESGFL